ncbi:MAG: hypothetical protein RRY79_03875 [Clostridia bacterium]
MEQLTINEQKKQFSFDWSMFCMILIMFVGYILIHDLLGGTLFSHCQWDSYTRQAMAWREGRMDLGENISWLELAIFNGKYYVSFPPLPSVLMLPLTFIFGYNTPNNFVNACYCIISAVFAYKCLRHTGVKDVTSAFIAMFVVWGANTFWMSTSGGVWFQAQQLNMLFCLASIFCVLKNKRVLAYLLLALAVGCRPLSLLYFPVLFIVFFIQDYSENKELGIFKNICKQLPCLIAPILIGASYMLYNYARFGNPLEFGHNYLPEFTESQNGQFSFSYLGQNLYNLFIRPIEITGDFRLKFPWFNGFWFYIANPIFLLMAVYIIRDIIKKRFKTTQLIIVLMMALNIILLCMHKTLGGWQFGARYTCDLIPFAFFYIIMQRKWKLERYERVIMVLGIMFNVYGALAINFIQQ